MEAVYIRAHIPTTFNRDGPKYNLSHILDSHLAHLTQKCANPYSVILLTESLRFFLKCIVLDIKKLKIPFH